MTMSTDNVSDTARVPGVRRMRYALVGTGLVLAFITLGLFVDEPVARLAAGAGDGIHAIFEWITQWGEGAWVLVPALVLWLTTWATWKLQKRYWARWYWRALSMHGVFVFAAVGIPGLTAAILKRLFGRARPYMLETEGPMAFRYLEPLDAAFQSFPSGHATTSIAFATALGMLFGRKVRWVWVPMILIAISRVVIGQHFLSDILFGAALGAFGAWSVGMFWQGKGWLFDPDASGWRNRTKPVLGHWFRRLSSR